MRKGSQLIDTILHPLSELSSVAAGQGTINSFLILAWSPGRNGPAWPAAETQFRLSLFAGVMSVRVLHESFAICDLLFVPCPRGVVNGGDWLRFFPNFCSRHCPGLARPIPSWGAEWRGSP
ncbi:hypothetical protein N7468_006591 [Penicillium chermesinum]|uniref:Uncharacterized protein n=1 Tax=Penicillium chermesinum TaxID=63820 RepID=A0A9W9TJS4_9EURO|nr:uncharacterized protein N7468_006591 [Penicillium chermesinum]KAJ5225366.1 hypothetical protein N7468_006591 [Penicillium chermesinum]